MIRPTYKRELALLAAGVPTVAGCDEVGRGCLAGPVVAAAVVMPPTLRRGWLSLVRDSKTLSAAQRKRAEDFIKAHATGWFLGEVDAGMIDDVNIHHASLLAMQRALKSVPQEVFVLIDGRFCVPDVPHAQTAVINGDARCLSIAAASIIAKVYRDELMDQLHEEYPIYGFYRHKGYATPEHRAALRAHGPGPMHRQTFCHGMSSLTTP